MVLDSRGNILKKVFLPFITDQEGEAGVLWLGNRKIVEVIIEDVLDFAGSVPQYDDITMVVVKL